jgi:Ala-tRNA(Pro) deacylase
MYSGHEEAKMGMAAKLETYLQRMGVDYELLEHPYSNTSMMTAQQAHIHGDQLAKGVVLEDEQGYLMAVIPSTHRLQLGVLHNMMHRRLGLATERELGALFEDCDLGAVPAAGDAYGIQMIVDDSLSRQPDVYFEAGDHTVLVHMGEHEFHMLMANAEHGEISRHT